MPQDPSASRFHWKGALILSGVLFIGVSDTQLIPPLLDRIAGDVGVSAGTAGLIVTVYALAAALSAFVIGPISDRFGRRALIGYALALFGASSLVTYQSSYLSTLIAARLLTGLSGGALSTLSLSLTADLYPYTQRGKAMGIVSMAYFAAFVVGIPVGTVLAATYSWRVVFLLLAGLAVVVLAVAALALPPEGQRPPARPLGTVLEHFRRSDRLAGILAALLTSGGLVGFLTYMGPWLAAGGVRVESIGLLFMAAGTTAAVASPLSGWLADRLGKIAVVSWSNMVLPVFFLVVPRVGWGLPLFILVGLLSVAASARQGPLHAVTTELVASDLRGSYVALRNAASQLGIAAITAVSAVAYDRAGFVAVSWIVAGATVLIPVVCLWMREPSTTAGE